MPDILLQWARNSGNNSRQPIAPRDDASERQRDSKRLARQSAGSTISIIRTIVHGHVQVHRASSQTLFSSTARLVPRFRLDKSLHHTAAPAVPNWRSKIKVSESHKNETNLGHTQRLPESPSQGGCIRPLRSRRFVRSVAHTARNFLHRQFAAVGQTSASSQVP